MMTVKVLVMLVVKLKAGSFEKLTRFVLAAKLKAEPCIPFPHTGLAAKVPRLTPLAALAKVPSASLKYQQATNVLRGTNPIGWAENCSELTLADSSKKRNNISLFIFMD